MDAEAEAARDRHDLALFAAWHVEAFARTKRLPHLKRLLDRKRRDSAAALDAKIRAAMSTFRRAER